jgi:hypothetical protein
MQFATYQNMPSFWKSYATKEKASKRKAINILKFGKGKVGGQGSFFLSFVGAATRARKGHGC